MFFRSIGILYDMCHQNDQTDYSAILPPLVRCLTVVCSYVEQKLSQRKENLLETIDYSQQACLLFRRLNLVLYKKWRP